MSFVLKLLLILPVHIVASGSIVFLNVSVQIQLLRKWQMLCLWFVCKRCLFLFAIWLNFRQRNLLTQRIAFAIRPIPLSLNLASIYTSKKAFILKFLVK